jgi:hypothetical protein
VSFIVEFYLSSLNIDLRVHLLPQSQSYSHQRAQHDLWAILLTQQALSALPPQRELYTVVRSGRTNHDHIQESVHTLRIGRFEIPVRRDLFLFQREHHLNDTGDSRGALRMANVGFDLRYCQQEDGSAACLG